MADRSHISQPHVAVDSLLAQLIQLAQSEPSLHQFQNWMSAHQYRHIYPLIFKYIYPSQTVLDWGTGNGHFSYFLVKAGYQTSGYGFERLPQICQSFSPEQYTYHQGDWSNPIDLPFPNEFFDAVMSIGVLEHVRETGGTEVASLTEIYRVLKPKGYFICVHFPNRYSWIEYAASKMKKWSHEYCYTEGDIRFLAKLTQFQILEIQRYAFLPRNIWSKLAKNLVNSHLITEGYNFLDDFLSLSFSGFCQNYLFVARKF